MKLYGTVKMISGKLYYEAPIKKIPREWCSLLEENLNTHAQQAALIVAERMRNPDFVYATLAKAQQQTHYRVSWSPASLASGAGLILMYEYVERCFPEQTWDTFTQQYLHLAAEYTKQSNISSSSLFQGTAGIAFALSQTSQEGGRYQRTLARLHRGLHDQVLKRAWRRPASEPGVAEYDYDMISGAAGTLVYLTSVKQPDEYVQATIEHLLDYLLWLAEPGQPMSKERWYIPPELLINDMQRQMYPQGKFTCGLANGIAGPLVALALTCLSGYRYPGLLEAIAYLAKWVVDHQVPTSWGLDWPDSVPITAASSPQSWRHLARNRPTWSNGSPGISRGLWLAGLALDDEHLRSVAVEAIESALRRPVTLRDMPSPDIYQGIAGLLQVCLRFAHESESSVVREHIPFLVKQILETFDINSELGFCDLNQENKPVDQPSWLSGASGVANVLLAASSKAEPSWDRILGIA